MYILSGVVKNHLVCVVASFKGKYHLYIKLLRNTSWTMGLIKLKDFESVTGDELGVIWYDHTHSV